MMAGPSNSPIAADGQEAIALVSPIPEQRERARQRAINADAGSLTSVNFNLNIAQELFKDVFTGSLTGPLKSCTCHSQIILLLVPMRIEGRIIDSCIALFFGWFVPAWLDLIIHRVPSHRLL